MFGTALASRGHGAMSTSRHIQGPLRCALTQPGTRAPCDTRSGQQRRKRAIANGQKVEKDLRPASLEGELTEQTSTRPVDGAPDDTCPVLVDDEGNISQVMCCDYGFRHGSERLYQDHYGEVPTSLLSLGINNFKQEAQQLRSSFRFNEYEAIYNANPPTNPITKATYWLGYQVIKLLGFADKKLEQVSVLSELKEPKVPQELLDDSGELVMECKEVREKLAALKLPNEAVWAREKRREEQLGKVTAPWYIQGAFTALCFLLDVVYDKRPVQRFWVLEVIARMPYFSYISILHLYESLGWWRAGAELRRVHFAEEWNELHHLQIMESLGGDSLWIDRFLAQHAALVYYWTVILFYAISPRVAYNFSELVEWHAHDTYAEFVDQNEALLRSLPPPAVAVQYYKSDDLYLFDALQTGSNHVEPRRPECKTLYDVFSNIRDDEYEHVKTMHSCQSAKPLTSIRLQQTKYPDKSSDIQVATRA